MSVTIKSTNRIPDIIKDLKDLSSKSLKVGVFGEDGNVDDGGITIATLARVHEYGMTIKPKRAKYLTIPANKKAKGKRAREISGLFFIPTGNGNGLLAKEKGKDEIEVYYILVKSVTIPERSFLRTGFDKNVDKIAKKMDRMAKDIIVGGINPKTFLKTIGEEFAGLIQKELKSLKSPPNEAVTIAAKGSHNPLMDTGRLVGAIRHKVE